MKIISKTLRLLPLLFVVFAFQACSDDDDNPPPQPTTVDIIATAETSVELTTLVTALQLADGDLVGLLQGQGPFTVLAPNNDAFAAFLDTNDDWDVLTDVPTAALAEVLKNHVIVGNLRSTDLTTAVSGYTNTSANAPSGDALSIYFDTTSGVVFNGISTVVTPDIIASNGTVHIVNQVITRPTIATFATANPALSSLVATLQLADTGTPSVSGGYIAAVSDANAGSFTVLAPTNDAFADLLVELGLSALTEVDAATADAILTYHITTAGNVQSSGLAGLNGTFPSLGGDIDIDATALTVTDVNDRVSNIIPTLVDIQAMNGVVHAIDTVLLPEQSED